MTAFSSVNPAIDAERTVADLVLERPSLAPIFDKIGIDYCCGGRKSLREACAKRGLDAETVVQALNALAGAAGHAEEDADWTRAGLTDLCNHIERTHHRYLIEALPRLEALVAKVTAVHGDRHPHLHRVKETFADMSRELLSHLQKEEQMLFPLIRRLEADGSAAPAASVAGPIRRMEAEHDASGDALATLRELTADYAPPEGACGSYRAMLAGLEELESDLHRHIHKENNILFPRAIEKERSGR